MTISKRTLLNLVGMVAAVAVLGGCAVSGSTYNEAAKGMSSLKPGDGRIYFFRSSSFVGAAMRPEIRLNGKVVGVSAPGSFFVIDQPAGRYTATASTETEKAVTFALQPGETKYVRSSISMGVMVGRAILELESADKANAEMPLLTYTGGTKISAN